MSPTFSFHSHGHTLLKPTVLAAITCVLVDDTLLFLLARILQVFLNSSLEETFASFAAEDGVVIPRAFVAAHQTEGALYSHFHLRWGTRCLPSRFGVVSFHALRHGGDDVSDNGGI